MFGQLKINLLVLVFLLVPSYGHDISDYSEIKNFEDKFEQDYKQLRDQFNQQLDQVDKHLKKCRELFDIYESMLTFAKNVKLYDDEGDVVNDELVELKDAREDLKDIMEDLESFRDDINKD